MRTPRRILRAAWTEERFLVRFWTALLPLLALALLIWWLA